MEPAWDAEAEDHAVLAATALNEVADPSDLRRLRWLLAAFETAVGSVALGNGTRPFSEQPAAQRERILLRWATSQVGLRRTFYQTVKRLGCFMAYADPGPTGTNPRWAGIGYSMPAEPTAEAGPVAASIVRPAGDGLDRLDLDADVVVVGSGAGGGVVAARLAEAGRDVLVVEAGPYVAESDMPRDELAAFNRLYLDHAMASTTDLGLAILAGSAVGGGTLVNWATCIEPPAWIRDAWAADHGLVDFDGPQTDSDLGRLREELGFASPATIGPKDQALLDGAAALGWEAAPTERSADGCGDCGACPFGCRRGAKRSGQRLHLAAAARAGARILPGARVERVDITAGRAEGVTGTLRGAGDRVVPFRVRARTVVVAAGALRTPVVLLRSGIAHPAVGANLHLHPTVVVAGRMGRPVEMWRGTMQAARSMQFAREGVLIESVPAHPGLIALGFPWAGRHAHDALMREIRRYVPFIGITRDDDGGSISVARSGRARVAYRVSERDARTARLALGATARLARAAGADRVVTLATPLAVHDVDEGDDAEWQRYLDRIAALDMKPNTVSAFSAHQMGSARAGSDPRTSACDPGGRVRTSNGRGLVGGLYVADASLFPTALGVNPMVTVMAMAARVARTVDSDTPS